MDWLDVQRAVALPSGLSHCVETRDATVAREHGYRCSCIQLSLHARAKALLRASGRQRAARRALLQALAWAQLLANLGVIKRFRDFSKSSCCNGGSVVCAGVACGGSVRHGRCTVVQLNATCSYLASVMSAEEAAMARGECLTAVHAPEAAVAPESAVQWAVRLTRLTG